MSLISFITLGSIIGAAVGAGYYVLLRASKSHIAALLSHDNPPPSQPKPSESSESSHNANSEIPDKTPSIVKQPGNQTAAVDLNYIPSIAIIYQNKQIQIYNNGRTNLYLWGAAYGNAAVPIDKEPRMISPTAYYYLLAENLENQLRTQVGADGEITTPFRAFITTEDSRKHTIRGVLFGKVTNGTATIHTQVLTVIEGWKNVDDPVLPEQSPKTRPPSDEASRRSQLLERLRYEYILSHDNISPALISGTEQPPADWVNKRLQEIGEKWRVSEKPPPSPPLPEVTLRFVYPQSPALVLVNSQNAIARDIKWGVFLWNMDLPDRNDPLPIPVQTFDWLRPGDSGGPQELFGTPLVAPLLKPGNRLFGCSTVMCPTCERGHTYIVYIVWGQGGWFMELKNEKSGHPLLPRNFLKETRESYFQELEKMAPVSDRVPI